MSKYLTSKMTRFLCLKASSQGAFGVASRNLHSSAMRRDIFKIQDEADFKQKVLQNKNLVILDFFAT